MWGSSSLQKSKRCPISVTGPSFSHDARGRSSDDGKFTFSPGVFDSSGSWPGLAGWNQPGSQVGAVMGHVVEHAGMRLSAGRQGGEGRSGGLLLRDCVGAALAEGLSLRPPRAGARRAAAGALQPLPGVRISFTL